MHGLFVEKYSLNHKALSQQLARHIAAHGPQGKAAIVTDKPMTLLASVRKQWLKLIRLMERERSSTLNPVRKEQLEIHLEWMRQLSFTAKAPEDILEAGITFATADDFVRTPPDCRMIYITYSFEREKLHMLTSWMPRNGVVVIYGQD
ncbi:MAG TPA: hypothetical protein VFH06_00680 [Candidatus Saccharimonadales bacterium]|nr:hypothetical protein [Candidatus Saccharimonadales bacterium]